MWGHAAFLRRSRPRSRVLGEATAANYPTHISTAHRRGGRWLHGELETELIGKERAVAGLPRCSAAGPAAVRPSAALWACCGREVLKPTLTGFTVFTSLYCDV